LSFDKAVTIGTGDDVFGNFGAIGAKISINAQGVCKIRMKFLAGHTRHPSVPAAPMSD
jgi:hypothetical protein